VQGNGGVGDESMEVRVLVSNYEAGVIIGKSGSNVKSIRDKTGCFVSILKSGDEKSERVMSIKGSLAACAQAMLAMTELVLTDKQAKETKMAEQGGQQAPVLTALMTVKLLIHKAHTGAVIGHKGAIIKEVGQVTGAKVHLSNDPLAGSTEKTVTVTGTPSAIHQAILRILTQIHDNPLKPGTSHTPYVPGTGREPRMGAPPGFYQGGGYQDAYGLAEAYSPYGGAYGGHAPPPMREGPENSQKIAIPTNCAGAVLGKGGTIIADIKRQTGTAIRIAPPEQGVPGERVVTVTGSPQGIQAAIALIRQRVEQPFAPWPGAVVPPPAPAYSPAPMPQQMAATPQYAPNPYAGYYQ